jgi:hypothetical protein
VAGSAQIGNLQVRLGIDTAQFSAGVKTVQSQLGTLGKGLKAFAIGAAGALSLSTIGGALKSAANRMDDLGKAAQKIGIPVAELSKLEYAAKLADVSLDQLAGSVGKFSKGLAEMQSSGKGSVAEALQALNIAAVDAQGKLRPTSDIMADIAAKFAVMQDGAGKTAIAMALFGRSGAELIPLLNGGREAIAAAGDELERFGGVVSEQTAVAAENFNDNLTRLQTAGEALTMQVMEALLPSLVDLTNRFVELVKSGPPVTEWVEALTSWFAELSPYIESTRKEIELLTTALQNLGLVEKSIPKLQSDFDALWGPGGPQTPAGGKTNLPSSQRTQPAPTLPNATRGTGTLPRTSSGSVPSITAYDIRGYGIEVQELTTSFDDANAAATQLVTSISDNLGNAIVGLASGTMSFKDAWMDMAESLKSSLSDILSQLVQSGLMNLLNFGGTQLGGAQGIAGFGGFYAEGGTLGAGKWGIAGENGPEIIHGPAGVTPMGAGGGMTVNVINQGGGQVEQRKRRGSNGEQILDVIVRGIARDEAMKTNRKTLPGMYATPAALTQR